MTSPVRHSSESWNPVERASLPANRVEKTFLHNDQEGQTYLHTGGGGQTLLSVNNSILLFAIFLSTFLLIGCEDTNESVVQPESFDDLIPFEVGNYWKYINMTYYPDDIPGLSEFEITVDTTVQIDDEIWYQFNLWEDLRRNTAEGIISRSAPDGDTHYVYHFPVEAGDVWFDSTNVSYLIVTETEIISVNEDLEVETGIFEDCIHYQSTETHYLPDSIDVVTKDEWIKQGLGIIKTINYSNWDSRSISELLEHNLE